MRPLAAWALALAALLCACKRPSTLADRPYGLVVPARHDPARPLPLLLALHGYGGDGESTRAGGGFDTLATQYGLLFAYPDGTRDRTGRRFWNATDACCDFYGSRVDDVAYLSAVIEDVAGKYAVDRKRIYVVGHSNGGFMANRLACERAGLIAAVVDISGAGWREEARCRPARPVAVLHIHGDADPVVRYEGGDLSALTVSTHAPPGRYPSARDTVAGWLRRNGCGPRPDSTETLPGLDPRTREARIERWRSCGAPVELWTLPGADHFPGGTPAFGVAIWAFLGAQHRP